MGRHCDASLDRIISAEGLASEEELLRAHARRLQIRQLDLQQVMASPVAEAEGWTRAKCCATGLSRCWMIMPVRS